MKAKFKLGFLTGFKNVPDAWPGSRHIEYLLEPMMVAASDIAVAAEASTVQTKALVFECRKIDQDKAAVFEFLEVR